MTPKDAILSEIQQAVSSLKPSLEGIELELLRQARSSHDARDFVINEFRHLTRAIDGLTAELARQGMPAQLARP